MSEDDPLLNALNINPPESSNTEIVTVDPERVKLIASLDQTERTIDLDYINGRDNMYNLIERGMEVLDDLATVAKASQHPRAYEVFSNSLKSIAEINKTLIELSQKKHDLDKAENNPEAAPQTVNNNLFVGTTLDLHNLLNKK